MKLTLEESNSPDLFGGSVEYEGAMWNGVPHGHGVHISTSGKFKGTKYVGEYIDGKPSGRGSVTFVNGATYIGEWKNGQFNGHGTFDGIDKRKYIGEWKDGNYYGQGTLITPDGGGFIGEWKDGRPRHIHICQWKQIHR